MRKLFATIFATVSLWHLSSPTAVKASIFGNMEVSQNRFVAIASPFGVDQQRYNLIIIEQVGNQRPCWREYGSNPTIIEPLYETFDFTGICSRSTDSNGYSIRVDNRDFSGDLILAIVRRGDELVLMGSTLRGRSQPVIIGRTQGIGNGYHKIILDPGWRFTQRTYQGQQLAHIYLTGDSAQVGMPGEGVDVATPPRPTPTLPPPSAISPTNPPGVTLPPPEREIIFVPQDNPPAAVPQPSNPPSDRRIPTF
ncbi:MAG: DUF3747 domain-containing protein [Jaaginema sp. PMC 1079.18]|nr:DUF3747 domain-containing protein [Jaaginema sp. PMC 1079.18]